MSYELERSVNRWN